MSISLFVALLIRLSKVHSSLIEIESLEQMIADLLKLLRFGFGRPYGLPKLIGHLQQDLAGFLFSFRLISNATFLVLAMVPSTYLPFAFPARNLTWEPDNCSSSLIPAVMWPFPQERIYCFIWINRYISDLTVVLNAINKLQPTKAGIVSLKWGQVNMKKLVLVTPTRKLL